VVGLRRDIECGRQEVRPGEAEIVDDSMAIALLPETVPVRYPTIPRLAAVKDTVVPLM
jgi:hypothetical protein